MLEDRNLLTVFTVMNATDSDPGSLRATIADASSGDTIQFDPSLAGQTITLTSGVLALSNDLTIIGLGADQLTVSGNNASPVFRVSAGVTDSISGLTISNASNTSIVGVGGGIINTGTLMVSDCTLSDNSASKLGGGIFNAGTLTVTGSTFSGNSAPQGGGILNLSTLTVSDSTLFGNTAATFGGGISSSATLTVSNSTLSGNSATSSGGSIYVAGGTCTLDSTIVAEDPGPAGSPDVSGTVTSLGNNLIGNTAGSSGWVDSDLQNVEPLLGPLQDNGGPTQTMALLPGSPAIDAGNAGVLAPTTDQRGEPRTAGAATDIGALEFQDLTATVVVTPVNVTYDGQQHGTTAEVFGVGGVDLGPAQVFYSSRIAPVEAGSYKATASFPGNVDYNSATGSASIVIGQATPTVVVTPISVTYDGQSHGATAEAFGINNVDLGSATVGYSSGTAPVNAGTYTATGTFAGSNDYAMVTGTASIAIGQFQLTVAAQPATRVYGSANPSFTYTITGFVNNDPASVVDGTPSLTTLATASSGVGAYTITAALGSLTATNYSFALQNGVLTITKATPVITWNNPNSISSPTPLSSTQLDATANAPGTFVYSPVAGTVLTVGTHTLATTFTPTDAIDYNTATATVTLQVTAVSSIGISVTGTILTIVGGSSSSDQIEVNSIGGCDTGSTGIQVNAKLNGVFMSKTFHQTITAIVITDGNGNDNIRFGRNLTASVSITAGNGNDNIGLGRGNTEVMLGDGNDNIIGGDANVALTAGKGKDNVILGNGNDAVIVGDGNDNVILGNGSDVVTAGDGNDNLFLGRGNDVIAAGNGNDNLYLGNGNNTITLGNGNDNTILGNGNNVFVEGNGDDTVYAGGGNNLIAAGLGEHTVAVGNGRNILIDGSVTLTVSGDSFRQVLNDWVQFGATASNVSSIRSRLSVTDNSSHANHLTAGSGLDWFWATYAHDSMNRKFKDLLN